MRNDLITKDTLHGKVPKSSIYIYMNEWMKADIKRLPDIVAIEAIDKDIASKIQEVDGGSSHRHLWSSWSAPQILVQQPLVSGNRRRMEVGNADLEVDERWWFGNRWCERFLKFYFINLFWDGELQSSFCLKSRIMNTPVFLSFWLAKVSGTCVLTFLLTMLSFCITIKIKVVFVFMV